jgi:putative spermidine/putrescine transport system ATP-binding protein
MYERPVSKYVADFIGETNILRGEAAGLPAGTWLAIRPEHIRPAGPADAGPRLTVTVREAVFTGAITRVHSTLGADQPVILHWPAGETLPAPGSALAITWPAERGVRVGE